MRFGSMRVFIGATAITVVCLLGAVAAAGQAGPVQNPQENVPMVDDVFKSVVLLRGIPVDTFFDTMGMFANAMGNDCTFCHEKAAYFDRTRFADATPKIMKARQMIVMMTAINKQYFGGQPRVTCFTCHSGNMQPKSDPNIALQYAPPTEDPNARDFPLYTGISANQIFDKYVQALGGADRLAKFTSYTAKGTYAGFDTALTKVPVEIFGKAPGQQATVVHMTGGDSFRIFDGRNGWWTGPDTPLPLVTLTGGNLDRRRLEAMVPFPAGIRQAFGQWRVGRTAIDDSEVLIVQGITDDKQPLANFYFDESGLLVRMVRWTPTPVGAVPTQIDYSDYREVAGVKMPFKWMVSQTFMQMTVELSDLQPNVQIAAARFAKPVASAAARPIAR